MSLLGSGSWKTGENDVVTQHVANGVKCAQMIILGLTDSHRCGNWMR